MNVKTLLVIGLITVAGVTACKKSKSKNDSAVEQPKVTETPPETTPMPAPTPTIPAPVTPQPPVPTTDQTWVINAANCANVGYGFDEATQQCKLIQTKEDCQALNNGSLYVTTNQRQGKCYGPSQLPSQVNCGRVGKTYDATKNVCVVVNTQAACENLGNGSIFNSRYGCIGPKYLPSQFSCGAWGGRYDETTKKCQKATTQAECDSLASGATFIPNNNNQGYCMGRCENKNRVSVIDDCSSRPFQ